LFGEWGEKEKGGRQRKSHPFCVPSAREKGNTGRIKKGQERAPCLSAVEDEGREKTHRSGGKEGAASVCSRRKESNRWSRKGSTSESLPTQGLGVGLFEKKKESFFYL